MSIQDLLSDYTLRPARSATTNSETTATATSGVVRNFEDYQKDSLSNTIVTDMMASQYRSSFIDRRSGVNEEYLLWASKNGTLTQTSVLITGDTPQMQAITSTVFRVSDIYGREIFTVKSIFILITDGPLTSQIPYELLEGQHYTWENDYATLTNAGQNLLQGGFSESRGDRFTGAHFYLNNEAEFFWVKNDQKVRFLWNDEEQAWRPLKGSNIVNLGRILLNETYELEPKIIVNLGEFLLGDIHDPQKKSLLRAGVLPTESSLPIKVKVVDDEGIEEYDFMSDPDAPDAVVGVADNVLVLSQAFAANNVGKFLWFSYEEFQEDLDGKMGLLKDAGDTPLFLCPIPEYIDRPLIRVGTRSYLKAIACRNESELNDLIVPNENTFGWSVSTGRLKFYESFPKKADPNESNFDIAYYEEFVIYDGVAHNVEPISASDPVALEYDGSERKYFIPFAITQENGKMRSGRIRVPDGTGIIPQSTASDPTPSGTGLVTSLRTVGEEFIYSTDIAIEEINVVYTAKDFSFFSVKKGSCEVALATGHVNFSNKDFKQVDTNQLFFRQGIVTPARTMQKGLGIMPSRNSEPYITKFGDVFEFEIGLSTFIWEETTGAGRVLTAEEAATVLNDEASINGLSGLSNLLVNNADIGKAFALDGRLYLEATSKTLENIVISFGGSTYKTRNLSGCTAFGFNAGWKVNYAHDICYLNDSGTSFGVFRSPFNKDKSSTELDFYNFHRTDQAISPVREDFYFHIDQKPMKDKMGFEDGVFFCKTKGIKNTLLRNYKDIIHQFDDNRFVWVQENSFTKEVQTEIFTCYLGKPIIFESTLIAPYFAKGVWLDEGGGFEYQTLNEDYLLLDDGETGTIAFIEPIGRLEQEGFNGSVGQNALEKIYVGNTNGVNEGDRIKILGTDLEGSYLITQVDDTQNNLTVSPPFSVALNDLNYQIFSGKPTSEFDPSIIADRVLYPVSHLPYETFVINLINKIGDTDTDGYMLTIDIADAEIFGRELSVRVGDVTSNEEYTPVKIGTVLLGNARNGAYTLDTPLLQREFLKISFGGGLFEYSKSNGNLYFVNTFSSGNGDWVEIGAFGSGIEGQVKFSDEALENRGGFAYMVETIDNTAALLSGEFYYNSNTLWVSQNHTGKIFLVQKAVLGEDVKTNPIGGSLAFTNPLKKGTIVEAKYFVADDNGEKHPDYPDQIVDRIPVFLRLQPATRVDEWTYSFNQSYDTIVEDGKFLVWVEGNLFRVGVDVNVVVDSDGIGYLKFIRGPLPETIENVALEVLVNYQVLEAQGGEVSYSTSISPLYRPPFRLEENQDTFVLESDRTTDFVQDGVMLLEGFLLRITSSVYDGENTTIVVSPPPFFEIGSLAPANDEALFVSGEEILSSGGFWKDIPFEYQPADRGMTEVVFAGNLTELANLNHILQLGEDLFLISGSELSDDGFFTKITLQCPLATGYIYANQAPRISVRPLFLEGTNTFSIGESVRDTYFELVFFEEGEVGKTLVSDIDYEGDEIEGDITFLPLFQRGLRKGDKLIVSRTKQVGIAPSISNGMIVKPAIASRFVNAYLSKPEGIIKGKYFYSHPDNFFTRVALNEKYLSEVAEDFSATMNSNGSSGSSTAFTMNKYNYKKGILGSRGKFTDTQNKDKAARLFISLYNEIIVGFEQVRETITGGFIGDRDGKFKFFVGRDNDLTPKGFENPFTGRIRPRNLWEEYFNDKRVSKGQSPLSLTVYDAIVHPDGAYRNSDYLMIGDDLDNKEILEFAETQKRRVKNDIDDLVLLGRDGINFDFTRGFWTKGKYRSMGNNHSVSRLYPEVTNFFSRIFAGTLIGVEGERGIFTNGREYNEEWYSTKGSQIGTIGNPAIGTIRNTSDVAVSKRLARARIVKYSDEGFSEIVSALNLSAGSGVPAIIATPVRIKDFPTDSSGTPDTTRFATNGGKIFDLDTGDYELHTPPFKVGDMVFFGKPDGTIIPTSVFINEIVGGCIITFKDSKGDPISDTTNFLDKFGEKISLKTGDTIFKALDDMLDEYADEEDPDMETLNEVAAQSSEYSSWFDVGVDKKNGELIDKTYSSEEDDRFPWKEWLRQRPPEPFECVEGITFFYNDASNPLKLPCLLGQEKDDTGDYSIPYMKAGETELTVLGRIAKEFDFLFSLDAASGNNAVFPDEVVGRSGNLTDDLLLTDNVNFLPVNGSYSPFTGLADVRPYDLLLIEPDENDLKSYQGILSIGSVSSNKIGVPRFLSEIPLGSLQKFVLYNAMSHQATVTNNAGLGENGIQIMEDLVNGYTTFDISSQTTYSWEGLLEWFTQTIDSGLPEGNRNSFRIEIIPHDTGTIAMTLDFFHTHTAGVSVDQKMNDGLNTTTITLVDMNTVDPTDPRYDEPNTVFGFASTGVFNFASLGLPVNGDNTVYFDFRLSLNAFDDSWGGIGSNGTSSPYAGSFLSSVGEDRLTFDMGISGISPTVRGTTHTNNPANNLESQLFLKDTQHEYGNDLGDGIPVIDFNSDNNINGGAVNTFLNENTFTLPAWEGHNNTPLTLTDIRFSAMATSSETSDGVICDGEGYVVDNYLGITADIGNQDTSITANPYTPNAITINNGSLSTINKGDVLVIKSLTHNAITGGSYIIRNVVLQDSTDPALPYQEITKEGGFGVNWGLDMQLPKVSFSGIVPLNNNYVVQVKNIPIIPEADNGDGNDTCFPSSGAIYIRISNTVFIKASYNSPPTPVSVDGENSQTKQFEMYQFDEYRYDSSSTTWDITTIDPISYPASYGSKRVFGATRFALSEKLIGYDDIVAGDTHYGIEEVVISYDGSVVATHNIAAANLDKDTTSASNIGVYVSPSETHGVFNSNTRLNYFPKTSQSTNAVPAYIDFSQIDWEALSGQTDLEWMSSGFRVSVKRRLLTGIFIEPSSPVPTQNLDGTTPKIVNNTYSVNSDDVGMRVISDFVNSADYPLEDPNGLAGTLFMPYEKVSFEVRRARRFQDIQNTVYEPIMLLPPIYMKKKGTFNNATTSQITGAVLDFFGDITDDIKGGDTLRILKGGALVEEAEISDTTASTISIRNEFFIDWTDPSNDPLDFTFEVYLQTPMIPHEQSFDQLVDAMTKEFILSGSDGSVSVRNNLVGADFTGVQQGDLVIVDPHPEGFRPTGDRGVSGRTGHVEGLPSELDDNRGFYRVVQNNVDSLELNPVHEFAGTAASPVIFGETQQEFAVLPVMSGTFPNSTPSPDGQGEGQNDLRPTAEKGTQGAEPNSFQGNFFSLAPFSYKIIRPSGLFSEEMIDFTLTQRERILSWIEEIKEPARKNKSGNYHIFQLEDHLNELHDPTDTSRGYGLVSNLLIESLSGVRTVSPFLNTPDCLSVQDRRYACGDDRLDYETPLDPAETIPFASLERTGTVLTTGSGRPSIIDRIDDILDSSDRLRNLRYTWISFRTNKGTGTLPTAQRAGSVLAKDLADEKDLINIKKSMERL